MEQLVPDFYGELEISQRKKPGLLTKTGLQIGDLRLKA